MKIQCFVFLIIAGKTFVSCDLDGFDLYTKDKHDFRQEINRLFCTHYFTTPLCKLSGNREVNDSNVAELIPVSSPNSTEDSFEFGQLDISPTPVVRWPLSKTNSTMVKIMAKKGIEIEGSGFNGDDEDDDEDGDEYFGSGMDFELSTTVSTSTYKPTTSKSVFALLSNPDYLLCGKSLEKDAHSCIALALNVRTFLNEIQILTQIILQMKPKHLNPNYSVFMPIFKVCFTSVNYHPSCDKYTKSNREVINIIANEMIDFARKRDSDLETAASGKDFKCLGANLIGIEKCVYLKITNEQVDQMIRVLILSTGNWNQEDCKDFQVVKQCILNSIEQCKDDITYHLTSLILRSDVITTCPQENNTTESNNNSTIITTPGPNNGVAPGITPGLLLTVAISVLISRL